MLTLPLGDSAELRALEPWQAAEFAAFIEAARPHLAPWLPWATSIIDEAGAREFLQRYADRQAAGEGRIYGIWLEDRLVGGTLFRTFDPASGVCELGVWLASSAQGRGLVTRAARHLIDWAIGTRGLTRVEWHCAVDNKSSIAVAQRLGMTREGVLRRAFLVDGARQDVEVWSLLAGE
ncbi:MAG TPA: GNAT family protein [Jatrophihabitantaceae bacterium]|jgi:RimJ/RimL family protein N-acetyltransferase